MHDEMPWLSLLATLVDFGGTLVVLAVVVACLCGFVLGWGGPAALDPLRRRLAESLVLALSFKTGAGVLRTITVGSFKQFAALLLIVALRFFLGRVLKAQVARHRPLHRLPGRRQVRRGLGSVRRRDPELRVLVKRLLAGHV